MKIIRDRLDSPQIIQLLREHHENMAVLSPPESVHALDISALKAADIAFWSVWDGDNVLGCGALKCLDDTHGEIKSMRTKAEFRRRGAAKFILAHIIDEARKRGYRRLSLETGSMPEFAPARALYQQHGFVECGPFADYVLDPYSTFMCRAL